MEEIRDKRKETGREGDRGEEREPDTSKVRQTEAERGREPGMGGGDILLK